MSEAPKRMWIHEGFWKSGDADYWASDEKECAEETLYIREDVVLELVEALKWMMAILVVETETDVKAIDRAEAALAKLEESHE